MSTTLGPSASQTQAGPPAPAETRSPSSARPRSASLSGSAGEARVLLRNVDWSLYEALDAARRDSSVPRLSYLNGDLELMSPLYLHELWSDRLHRFVVFLAHGLERDYRCAGSTTWRRREVERAKEPDVCFYFGNLDEILTLKEIDPSIHPPPDLAIEVEPTHPLLDSLAIYAGLRVPEVWTYDGQVIRFLHLQGDGTYTEQETSRTFPTLRSWEVAGWLARAEVLKDREWARAIEAWARAEVAPRPAAPRPGGA